MAQIQFTIEEGILKELFTDTGRDKAYTQLLETLLNQVLLAESEEQIGVAPYVRHNDRTAYRNGNRQRPLKTRIGSITLNVPKHRGGTFSTKLFKRYERSEQALVLAMMEMVINGVSTRKVSAITKTLCGESFSKSTVSKLCERLDPEVKAFQNRPLEKWYPFVQVDAMYIKVRENGRVVSKGFLIAIGIGEDGCREILGFTVADSESEDSWQSFFSSLKARGLEKVQLVTSDSHTGLVSAIKKQFQGATWQRCQTHFSKNILDKAPKKLHPWLKQQLKNMYTSKDLDSAKLTRDELLNELELLAPKAALTLENGFDDVMAVMCFPEALRTRLRTTNGVERLNAEIRRREYVIRIFPNEQSVIRLLGSYLIEHNNNWIAESKAYLNPKFISELIPQQKDSLSAAPLPELPDNKSFGIIERKGVKLWIKNEEHRQNMMRHLKLVQLK